MENQDQQVVKANQKINEYLEDSQTKEVTSKQRFSEAEVANIKINDQFYDESHQINQYPTYINNNTPAIKITGDDR
ncbi:hypothetical protein LCL95_12065 [Bacillus timonensis]|nr:hypothetical protein [Bacillus timonensis]